MKKRITVVHHCYYFCIYTVFYGVASALYGVASVLYGVASVFEDFMLKYLFIFFLLMIVFHFRVDAFTVYSPNNGSLTRVRIRHDNEGVAAGWFLSKVSYITARSLIEVKFVVGKTLLKTCRFHTLFYPTKANNFILVTSKYHMRLRYSNVYKVRSYQDKTLVHRINEIQCEDKNYKLSNNINRWVGIWVGVGKHFKNYNRGENDLIRNGE